MQAHKRLGVIYYSLLEGEVTGRRIPTGDTLNKAIRQYEAAIGRLDPRDGDSLLVLGRLYGQAGRPREAIAALEKSLWQQLPPLKKS